MKKNTNLKKNLVKKSVLPAAFAVLGSAIALTSVSYAWFTQGNTGSVEGIDVNVQTADGLQMSATGTSNSYKSIIQFSEFSDAGTQNKLPGLSKIAPLSSGGDISTAQVETLTTMKLFTGVKNADGTIKATDAISGNYVQLDLYFDVLEDKDLYLNTTDFVAGNSGNSYVGVKGKGSTVNAKDTDKGIQNAVRIAFIDCGSTGDGSGQKTAARAQALPSNSALSSSDTAAKIWEPNNGMHDTKIVDQVGADVVAENDAGYNGLTEAGNNLDEKSAGKAVQTLKNAGSAIPENDGLTGHKIATLEAGFNKIRIVIWVEGQDVDCKNYASGTSFTANLLFAQAKAAGK